VVYPKLEEGKGCSGGGEGRSQTRAGETDSRTSSSVHSRSRKGVVGMKFGGEGEKDV